MANIKSAIKRVKTSEKANVQNSAQKAAMRTSVKKAETALSNKADESVEATKAAARQLDKAAQKGLISKNAAARKKSRLTKKANAV